MSTATTTHAAANAANIVERYRTTEAKLHRRPQFSCGPSATDRQALTFVSPPRQSRPWGRSDSSGSSRRAPHAARSLVGRAHAQVVPVAVLLGAVLVCLGDLLGRTVIAPAQLGAGILTALFGTPYFVWLLLRTPRRGKEQWP